MENQREQETLHAILVILGKFAQEMGLISGIEGVKLGQKSRDHTPQSKVMELLVGILSGVKYLQDISLSAHPLDKDLAVAQAWWLIITHIFEGRLRTEDKVHVCKV